MPDEIKRFSLNFVSVRKNLKHKYLATIYRPSASREFLQEVKLISCLMCASKRSKRFPSIAFMLTTLPCPKGKARANALSEKYLSVRDSYLVSVRLCYEE